MRLPLLIISLALFSGCTTLPKQVSDPLSAWASHSQRLQGLTQWQLQGRLAINNDGEGWHASLAWQQSEDEYDIRIKGPFGQGSVRLQGNDEVVVLDQGGGLTTLDRDPESLLERQLGWQVPVSSLRFWITGLPAPGEAQHQLDEQGRLALLEQRGWSIRFLDYQLDQLPRKLVATRGEATVKVVIGEWLLPPSANPVK